MAFSEKSFLKNGAIRTVRGHPACPGWRIDYFLISDRLRTAVTVADIHDQVMGSDHCPVILELQGVR